MFRAIHKAYRAAYRINRAARTAEVVESGDPRRMGKLAVRRVAYKGFARVVNKLLK